MSIAYLLTGSNQGSSVHLLKEARTKVGEQGGKITKESGIYKTEPWGNPNQPAFLNQVLRIETALSPHALLQKVLGIESEMGRTRSIQWEPRLIDIDILFYDDLILQGNLNIPHPLLQNRRFVLVPLDEIAPEFVHPLLKKTVAALLAECPDNGIVEKL